MGLRRQHALIIENPVAGKTGGQKSEIRHTVIRILSERSYHCTACVTRKHGDATDFVRRYAAGMDLIVCCGGDGTINEVVAGVLSANTATPICYLPTGTTNDLARTLCLPFEQPFSETDALALLTEGVSQYLDAGLLNGVCFTYTAAFGAFSDVAYKTPQRMKNRLGYVAYWLYGLRNLFKLKPYRVAVGADGQAFEGRFVYGCVSNSISIGGVLRLDSAQVDLRDGRMELLLIRYPQNSIKMARLLSDLARGNYANEHVVLAHVERASFDFSGAVDWTVDGEFAGSYQSAEIEVKHAAYQIYLCA